MKSVKKQSKKAETNDSEEVVGGFSITYETEPVNDAPTMEESPPSTLEEVYPKWGSPEWQKFVMGFFHPEELYDGYPKCFGLRRVARELLGDIVVSRISHMSVIPQVVIDQSGSERTSRAVTIAYELVINFKTDLPVNVYFDMNNVNLRNEKTFTGVADCIEDTRSVFGRHPAASAETKAESRALKKALGLSILTAEEKISGYDDLEKSNTSQPEERTQVINKELKNFIEAKAKTFNKPLNEIVLDFAKSNNRHDLVELYNKTKSISEFLREDGLALFAYVNKYQQR